MILVDTSVWIDFLRTSDSSLSRLLQLNQVCMHQMVLGELACGNLRNRAELLSLWRKLPQPTEASYDETLIFVEQHQLMGRGVGYVDIHLLAACVLSDNTLLWTNDRRLQQLAAELNIAWCPT